MVHFERYHLRTGCNMQFLVPLYCVVSCKQLICWHFSCLPFNRRKCWKNKSLGSQVTVTEDTELHYLRDQQGFWYASILAFSFTNNRAELSTEVQKNNRDYKFQRQNAANQHITCVLRVSASSTSKLLMVNFLKYLILLQDSSFCVPVSSKLKGLGMLLPLTNNHQHAKA